MATTAKKHPTVKHEPVKEVKEEVKETHDNVIKSHDKVKIVMKSFYLGDMGRFERNKEYEVDADFAENLIKHNDAERV